MYLHFDSIEGGRIDLEQSRYASLRCECVRGGEERGCREGREREVNL